VRVRTVADRVSAASNAPKTHHIKFLAYDLSATEAILWSRLGAAARNYGAVEANAVRLCAQRVVGTSDVRRGVSYCKCV
jgi:Cdc6-like AAA superfamily ATPase